MPDQPAPNLEEARRRFTEKLPSGKTLLEEMREFAAALPDACGPRFGSDVLRLIDLVDALLSEREAREEQIRELLAEADDGALFGPAELRAFLPATESAQAEHEIGEPIYSEERGRWWVECSCGWARDEKSEGMARAARDHHFNAVEEFAQAEQPTSEAGS